MTITCNVLLYDRKVKGVKIGIYNNIVFFFCFCFFLPFQTNSTFLLFEHEMTL